MSQLTGAASTAVADAAAYTAAILAALGTRDPFEVLRTTAAALRQAVAGVSDATAAKPEKPGKWSMRHVVQHLADAELVGAFRFRMIMAHDRPALQGYDQDLWAERLRYGDSDPAGRAGAVRRPSRRQPPAAGAYDPEERRRAGIHAERGEEIVEHMMRMYAGHDLVHLRQLARIARAVGAEAR
jgi:hypothetical protein